MLKSAIETLDKNDPDNWTGDDQPRVDVVSKLVGRDVTRKEITEAMLEPEIVTPEPLKAVTGPELFAEADGLLQIKLIELAAVQKDVDTLRMRCNALRRYEPKHGSTKQERTDSVRHYIQRQHEVRMAKAMENQRRAAIAPAPLDTRSGIDRALQDKGNRNRPKF
jgi:hypothetical protein